MEETFLHPADRSHLVSVGFVSFAGDLQSFPEEEIWTIFYCIDLICGLGFLSLHEVLASAFHTVGNALQSVSSDRQLV